MTRTKKAGFLKDIKRLTVLSTRARVAMVILGCPKLAHPRIPLSDLFSYVEKNNAYINVRTDGKASWHKFCDKCTQHDHTTIECKAAPKFPICIVNRRAYNHALRLPTRSYEASPQHLLVRSFAWRRCRPQPIQLWELSHWQATEVPKRSKGGEEDLGGKKLVMRRVRRMVL